MRRALASLAGLLLCLAAAAVLAAAALLCAVTGWR